MQDRPYSREAPAEADLVVLGSGVGGLTAALTARPRRPAACRSRAHRLDRRHQRALLRNGLGPWQSLSRRPWRRRRRRGGGRLSRRAGRRARRCRDVRERSSTAPRAMLRDLEQRAGLAFRPYMTAPDYRQDHPGAAKGGRALEPLPFDGRRARRRLRTARVAASRADAARRHDGHARRGDAADPRRPLARARCAGRAPRHALPARPPGYARGTRLVLGNALVARLLKALRDRGVPVLTGCARIAWSWQAGGSEASRRR